MSTNQQSDGDLEFRFEYNAAYTDVLLGCSGPPLLKIRVCLELYLCYAMCLESAQLLSLILKNYRLVSRKSVFVPVTSLYCEVHAIPLQSFQSFFFFFQIPHGGITNDIYFLYKRVLQVKYELDFFGTSSWNSFPSSHCSCA